MQLLNVFSCLSLALVQLPEILSWFPSATDLSVFNLDLISRAAHDKAHGWSGFR